MVSYELENKNGWIELPTGIKKVEAIFKDGHQEVIDFSNFLTLKPKQKKNIIKINCYFENE